MAALQFGVAAGVVMFVGLSVIRQFIATRARSRRRVAVARAVAQLVRELEAGTPADDALATIGELGREVQREMAGLARLADDDPLARVALTWPISARTGVPLMALLTQVRADLAAREETDREVRAGVAGAQASAVLLAGLPVLGLLLGAALGGAPLAVLFGSRPGRLLLDAGLIFDAAGVLWTRRIVAGAQRVGR
jgi:tight adherence protein B